MQEINFAVLEGCKPNELLPKLGLVVNCILKDKPDLKGLKRCFKEHDFYDKERFTTVLNFLDIDYSDEKHIKAGEFLTQLSKIIDPEDRKRLLFDHLTKKNEILMKYIMDALAERLHSTNEMYRYITSYVYPGITPTLVDFRAWVAWLEASEHIKTVGIRWGLSELGKEAMEKSIKLIDVDDLLDEEGMDDDDDDDDDDDEVESDDGDDDDETDEVDDDDDKEEVSEAPVSAAPAAPAPVAPAAPVSAAPAPVEPAAPVVPAPAAPVMASPMMVPMMMESPVSSTSHVEVIVTPVKPKFDETPLELVRSAFAEADAEEEEDEEGEMDSAPKVRIEQFRLDEELVTDNVHAIQSWWRTRPGGRLLSSADYGFSADSFEDAAYGLFRLSALALQLFRYSGRLNTSRGGQSFAMLDQMGLYSNLMRSKKAIDKLVCELMDGGIGGRAEDLGNLHWLLMIRRSLLKLGDKGVRDIFESDNMQDVVASLWQNIGACQLTYEIIWIARELAVMGLLKCENAGSVGVVPLPKVRETAFRLGFIETPYAADFMHLVQISRRLTKFFGAGDAFEAPLVYFEPKRELRYDSSEPSYFTRDQLGID